MQRHTPTIGQLSLRLFEDAVELRDLVVSSLGNDQRVRVVRELALRQGAARADVAIISDRIEGFEIKSAHDDLRRLAQQVTFYSEVFDRVTVVTAPSHLGAIHRVVPDWWGLVVAQPAVRHLDLFRPAGDNPAPDSGALVRLLHRDETVALIAEHTGQTPRGSRSKLWSELLAAVDGDQLRAAVCRVLRERQDWSIAY